MHPAIPKMHSVTFVTKANIGRVRARLHIVPLYYPDGDVYHLTFCNLPVDPSWRFVDSPEGMTGVCGGCVSRFDWLSEYLFHMAGFRG
jgi:hypothetical protein